MKAKLVTVLFVLGLLFVHCQPKVDSALKTSEIRIRDPFIFPDPETKMYYMYAQSANRADSDFIGVEVYAGTDLENWTVPQPVLTLPDDAGITHVWAPEMHAFHGKYYLFVTLTFDEVISHEKPVKNGKWRDLVKRGTHIFVADSPLGPFQPLKDSPHTPPEWMALDGSLWVENGVPYMVFCHEWIQLIDGSMDYVQLADDLSDTVGETQLLFHASDAPGAFDAPEQGKVTDGCFIYKSLKSGRLFMIWSTFIPGKKYCVVLTYSQSGSIAGPWREHTIIYDENGGHGMIFETFDGRQLLALHQPNGNPNERLHLFEIEDDGEMLSVVGKVK